MSRGYGVSKITIGEITIEFGLEPIAQVVAPKVKLPVDTPKEPEQAALPLPQPEDSLLEELLFTDPYAYEQLAKKGLTHEISSATQ